LQEINTRTARHRLPMKSVLITGVSGFIGHHLARRYLNSGYKVLGIDNFSTSDGSNIKEFQSRNFEFYNFDLTKLWPSKLNESPEQPEFVFHLASPAAVNQYSALSLETLAVNSQGLENVLYWSLIRKSRVIFASTSEIYGSPLVHPQPESYWGAVNSYGERSCYDEGKRFGEALIFSWNKRHLTNHGLVRIFNTFGPGMNPNDGRVCRQFLVKALNNENLQIYGDGRQTRSFCYIDDLIEGIFQYAQSKITDPINLGSDEESTVLDLANTVIGLTKSQSKIVHVDEMIDDPPQRRPDLSKARDLLGYKIKFSLIEGLLQMMYSLKHESKSENLSLK
jgi:nucleoside-diphosphate-sugar epimerase